MAEISEALPGDLGYAMSILTALIIGTGSRQFVVGAGIAYQKAQH